MAEAIEQPPVKLICGMIFANAHVSDEAGDVLAQAIGPVELVSEIMDFDFTHYYDRQMGSPLHRRFVAFAGCASPDVLIDVKLKTNAIEHDFAARCGGRPTRPINLDPGYVELSKLVLASMKNFSHRIYLGRGVYAEVTLMYHKGAWQALPWTFPDYASGRYHPFLTEARQRLRQQAKREEDK